MTPASRYGNHASGMLYSCMCVDRHGEFPCPLARGVLRHLSTPGPVGLADPQLATFTLFAGQDTVSDIFACMRRGTAYLGGQA